MLANVVFTYRKQRSPVHTYALRKAHSCRPASQLRFFCRRQKRRFAAGTAVCQRLADEQADLRVAGSHQLDDMVAGRLLHVLVVHLENAVAGFELRRVRWTYTRTYMVNYTDNQLGFSV